MRNGAQRYRDIADTTRSARQTEIAAFALVIRDLEDANQPNAPTTLRIAALGRAHDLWSLLVRDLARDGNGLPQTLKTQLVDLGLWAMRYSTLAILKDLPLSPLIEVCQNVLDGLRAQPVPMTTNQNAKSYAPLA